MAVNTKAETSNQVAPTESIAVPTVRLDDQQTIGTDWLESIGFENFEGTNEYVHPNYSPVGLYLSWEAGEWNWILLTFADGKSRALQHIKTRRDLRLLIAILLFPIEA